MTPVEFVSKWVEFRGWLPDDRPAFIRDLSSLLAAAKAEALVNALDVLLRLRSDYHHQAETTKDKGAAVRFFAKADAFDQAISAIQPLVPIQPPAADQGVETCERCGGTRLTERFTGTEFVTVDCPFCQGKRGKGR